MQHHHGYKSFTSLLVFILLIAEKVVSWQTIVTRNQPQLLLQTIPARWSQPHRQSHHRRRSASELHVHIDSEQEVNGGTIISETKDYGDTTVYKLDLDDDAVPFLQRRLQEQQQQNQQESISSTTGSCKVEECVQVEGYLTSTRSFGASFCFFDLSKRNVQVPVQFMFKRQSFRDPAKFDGFRKSLVPGIRLAVTGPVAPTRNPGEALILVQDITIQKLPHNPQHVRKLLRLVNEGLLDATDLVQATRMDSDETLLQAIQEATSILDPSHPKVFNGLAKQILEVCEEELENDKEYPCFTTDHKYTTSLPLAPLELQQPPQSLLGVTIKDSVFDEIIEPLSVEAALQHNNMETKSTAKTTIDMVGWVQNRRRFRNSITSLEVVDEMVPSRGDPGLESDQIETFSSERLKCIVHPKVLSCLNATQANMYGQLVAPGSKVRLLGQIVMPGQGDNDATIVPSMWIHTIELLHSSWRPSAVQFLIEQTVAREVRMEEAAQALKITPQRMASIVALDDLTMRQWESAEISRDLQKQTMDLSLHVDPEGLEVLQDFADLRAKHPIKVVDTLQVPLSKADFVSTQGSRWKRKKEPQLDWMAQQVASVLQKRFPSHDSTGMEPIRILDVGGGKGYLANHLAKTLLGLGFDVRILVLDVSESAIRNGRWRSERRNLTDVIEYVQTDASTVDLSQYGRVDLVVALHACGALTDVALGHAVNLQASFVICPCCFCSNPSLLVPQRSIVGNTTTKMLPAADWLEVDSLRYDKLKSLAELQGDIKLSNDAVHTICALRLSAAERETTIPMKLSLHSFPIAFSTRNSCLVGTIE